MDPGRRPLHHHHHHAGGGGREDIWSEDATAALIDAWGDRHLRLSRGSLRQKDWKEVADAVNERREAVGKPPKTDAQCKNRIDTLKKKYKIEKAKPGPSEWSFFSRLDLLIGDAATEPYHRPTPSLRLQYSHPLPKRHPSLVSTVKHRNPNGAVHLRGSSESSPEFGDGNDDEDVEGDAEADEEEDDDDDDDPERKLNGMFAGALAGKRRRDWGVYGCGMGDGDGGHGPFSELARAIMNFADVYERVENSKQRQMMELELKRMEFAKDLEFQRMQMIIEAQIEVEKMKRRKNTSGSGEFAGTFRPLLFAAIFIVGCYHRL
ncbi:hypothetical protein B296_00041880 [Ensete ventricosum]|uniref:Myb/SANT-like DNA-binding domain-containing protein n=1 Tax=Ensete ventricosum TaxID=4639 RepID=A0A426Y706_ENSVE|nr:hypothetical protein B296_00041880 [Ensete ventricosum]